MGLISKRSISQSFKIRRSALKDARRLPHRCDSSIHLLRRALSHALVRWQDVLTRKRYSNIMGHTREYAQDWETGRKYVREDKVLGAMPRR
jgi:DNA-binding transcriptional regulator YiaG